MSTYSFLDVQAAITGPGGGFLLGSGEGAAEEGITIAAAGDKSTMTIGAGGDGMHSLHGDTSGTVTVRLLKTSPVNAMLSEMYAFQTNSSITHGQNVLVLRDIARGDTVSCRNVAFKKFPDLQYAKEGGNVEWVFDALYIDRFLGVGAPDLTGLL